MRNLQNSDLNGQIDDSWKARALDAEAALADLQSTISHNMGSDLILKKKLKTLKRNAFTGLFLLALVAQTGFILYGFEKNNAAQDTKLLKDNLESLRIENRDLRDENRLYSKINSLKMQKLATWLDSE